MTEAMAASSIGIPSFLSHGVQRTLLGSSCPMLAQLPRQRRQDLARWQLGKLMTERTSNLVKCGCVLQPLESTQANLSNTEFCRCFKCVLSAKLCPDTTCLAWNDWPAASKQRLKVIKPLARGRLRQRSSCCKFELTMKSSTAGRDAEKMQTVMKDVAKASAEVARNPAMSKAQQVRKFGKLHPRAAGG